MAGKTWCEMLACMCMLAGRPGKAVQVQGSWGEKVQDECVCEHRNSSKKRGWVYAYAYTCAPAQWDRGKRAWNVRMQAQGSWERGHMHACVWVQGGQGRKVLVGVCMCTSAGSLGKKGPCGHEQRKDSDWGRLTWVTCDLPCWLPYWLYMWEAGKKGWRHQSWS